MAVSWGRPSTAVRGVWRQALSLSRPPVPGGGQPEPVARVSRARVWWAWGTQHRLHSVRSCELALRAVGLAGGLPRGGYLAPLRGASEVRRSSSPSCPSSGLTVGVRYRLGVGADVREWGPGIVPLACMPCRGLRAAGELGGRHGGVGSHRCEGRLVSGAVPLPAACPWGRASRTRCPCVLGTGGLGIGDPAPAPQRALLRAGVARCGGGGRAWPGGCLAPL